MQKITVANFCRKTNWQQFIHFGKRKHHHHQSVSHFIWGELSKWRFLLLCVPTQWQDQEEMKARKEEGCFSVWFGINTLKVSWWEETNSDLSWVGMDQAPLGNSSNSDTFRVPKYISSGYLTACCSTNSPWETGFVFTLRKQPNPWSNRPARSTLASR